VATLLSYLTTTRFILHDPNQITFSDQQLTNCINLARDRVTCDTVAPQALVLVPLVNGQEAYAFGSAILPAVQAQFMQARAVQSILGCSFVQTPTLKEPMEPLAWSDLHERYRTVPQNGLPEAFALLSDNAAGPLYVGPTPSGTTWNLEVRCSWLAQYLVQYSDVETSIASPYAEALVPLFAARWAWSFNDDEETADKLEEKYLRELMSISAAMPPFRSIPYSSIY
jgi:hypothetical protein